MNTVQSYIDNTNLAKRSLDYIAYILEKHLDNKLYDVSYNKDNSISVSTYNGMSTIFIQKENGMIKVGDTSFCKMEYIYSDAEDEVPVECPHYSCEKNKLLECSFGITPEQYDDGEGYNEHCTEECDYYFKRENAVAEIAGKLVNDKLSQFMYFAMIVRQKEKFDFIPVNFALVQSEDYEGFWYQELENKVSLVYKSDNITIDKLIKAINAFEMIYNATSVFIRDSTMVYFNAQNGLPENYKEMLNDYLIANEDYTNMLLFDNI